MIKLVSVTIILLLTMSPLLVALPTQNITPLPQANYSKPREIFNLPSNKTLTVTFVFQPKNYFLLQQLVEEGKILSQYRVAQLFYPKQEVNHYLNYLRSFGLSAEAIGGITILATGTVSQLERALGVKLFSYVNANHTFISYYGSPSIPAFLTFSDLSPFFAKPQYLQVINKTQTVAFSMVTPRQLREAYNITENGKGTTIGLVEFDGDPYIYQQLQQFDSMFNLSNANLTIMPIGGYNPQCGIPSGWALEMSLDVEYAHAIAPYANLIAYVINPNYSLLAALSYIVQQDQVDVLSMSFGLPEYYVDTGSISISFVQSLNYIFLLGEVEGITFVAASGDAGGNGYDYYLSTIGSVNLPASDPYVLAVGGTSLYPFASQTYQTAWSGNGVYGATTGGNSSIFPSPWYQGLQGYRAVPDVSADANPYTGADVVYYYGQQVLVGGTSLATPIVAGIVAGLDQVYGRLGFINPLLYSLKDKRGLEPITFGYNTPYIAEGKYNLVTGLGVMNQGILLHYIHKEESIVVGSYNSTFNDGQTVEIVTNTTLSGPLQGYVYNGSNVVESFPLNKVGNSWIGSFTAQGSGELEVVVKDGNYSSGTYITVGLQVQFVTPPLAILENGQFAIIANLYYANGTGYPAMPTVADYYYYNPLTNSLKYVTNSGLYTSPYFLTITLVGNGYLSRHFPQGVYFLEIPDVFGFDEFVYGIYVVPLVIPSLSTEPLIIAPGENMTLNVLVEPYLPNVTFYFENLSGVVYSKSVNLIGQGNSLAYAVQTKVPNLSPGYYTVIANATFAQNNFTYYGIGITQIYVGRELKVNVNVPSTAFQNETIAVNASIMYPNGTPVRAGSFTAVVIPSVAQSNYDTLELSQYTQLVYFNGSWVGIFTIPNGLISNEYQGGTSDLGGLWDIYVVGESYNGFVTPTSVPLSYTSLTLGAPTPSAEFAVLPYVYTPFFNGTVAYMQYIVNATIINHNATFIDSVVEHLYVRNGSVNFVNTTVEQLIRASVSQTVYHSHTTSVNFGDIGLITLGVIVLIASIGIMDVYFRKR
ncbi:hypothetical protein HS7_21370 [Sulfolobales archaeon HS-7]|nr:hypothetical protein HS7_21370 [Sulfolobales archaeon HS-7]